MYTTGTAEETPNGQRRLRLASATNAAVPAYVELGLPLHTYHLPHWRRSGSLARAPIHANPFQISRFPTFLEKVRERRGNRAIGNLRIEFTTEMEREVCEGYSRGRGRKGGGRGRVGVICWRGYIGTIKIAAMRVKGKKGVNIGVLRHCTLSCVGRKYVPANYSVRV